jgi:hypothetical protein
MAKISSVLILLIVLLLAPTAGAQPTTSEPSTTAELPQGRLTFGVTCPEKGGCVQLGTPLTLRADGKLAESIRDQLAMPTGVLTLYLDGIRMEGITAKRLSEPAPGQIEFAFDLRRDAEDDKNRKAWDALLKTKNAPLMEVRAAITVGKDSLKQIDVDTPFSFYVADTLAIYATFALGLVVLIGSLVLLVQRSRMLRDEGTGLYSLGKSQMAFWGLLVVLTFFGVWLLTGTMERIPAQALVLLGISAGTGLSAVLIGRDDQGKKAEQRQKLDKLLGERDALQVKQPATLTSVEVARLETVKAEVEAMEESIKAAQPRGFWKDIVNDGNGASFHRVQVVIWTIVLGAVFIRAIMQTMSMPEFPETLLVLMGISNATYLGFKTAEK